VTTVQGHDAAAATARLREALEEIAAALEAADLDRLLQAEGGLELAMRRLVTMGPTLAAADRAAIRLEIRAARHTLSRCRMLGATLLDVVRLSLEAQGRNPGYGRREDAAAAFGPRALNARG
jgi:hypothetical protein